MDLDLYTPDTICRSMGLRGFVEEGWTRSVRTILRVLLKPSFHPEVCLTLTEDAGSARLSVVALSEMLWLKPSPFRLQEHREEASVPSADYAAARTNLAEAVATADPTRRFVMCDGMSVDACLVSDGVVRHLSEPVVRPPLVEHVAHLIALAWDACHDPRVKNRLADCATYVGIERPRSQERPTPPLTRMLVLGVPEAKAEFFDLLMSREKPSDSGGMLPRTEACLRDVRHASEDGSVSTDQGSKRGGS